jgi:hypothetical protein
MFLLEDKKREGKEANRFQFREKAGYICWDPIAKVDIEELKKAKTDFEPYSSKLVYYQLSPEDEDSIDNPILVKAFKLAQFYTEYLETIQAKTEKQLQAERKDYCKIKKLYLDRKAKYAEQKQKIVKYKNEIKQKKEQIKLRKTVMKESQRKKENNKTVQQSFNFSRQMSIPTANQENKPTDLNLPVMIMMGEIEPKVKLPSELLQLMGKIEAKLNTALAQPLPFKEEEKHVVAQQKLQEMTQTSVHKINISPEKQKIVIEPAVVPMIVPHDEILKIEIAKPEIKKEVVSLPPTEVDLEPPLNIKPVRPVECRVREAIIGEVFL